MCEANAYMLKGDKEHLIMESVDVAEPEDENTWRLIGIFGDQKMVKGRIVKMSLVNHKILFEPRDERQGPAI
jgi:predicted RNA-binding protein